LPSRKASRSNSFLRSLLLFLELSTQSRSHFRLIKHRDFKCARRKY